MQTHWWRPTPLAADALHPWPSAWLSPALGLFCSVEPRSEGPGVGSLPSEVDEEGPDLLWVDGDQGAFW